MKATYDVRTDTLSIILKDGRCGCRERRKQTGVILDYDQDGNLVSLEMLDASTRMSDLRRFEFETTDG